MFGRLETTMKRVGVLAAVAAAVACSAVSSAVAQQPITLKFAHLFPETLYIWKEGGKVFADEVTQRTNGRVKFEVYPAGQLGKDYLALLQSGVADVVVIVPSYQPDKFPRSSVTELPGLYSSSCEGAGKVWAMAQEGGLLNKQEYKPLGIHVLFVGTNPPNHLMTTNKATPTLDDIAGLKLRVLGGGAMDKAVRALGAIPIRLNTTELYDALSRGTVDGAAYTYVGVPDFRLETVLHHGVTGGQFGSGSFLYAMSDRAWKALPDDVKAVMTEASQSAQSHLCKWQDDNDQKARDKIVAENGFKITTLSPEQAAKWQERMATVSNDWVAEMDKAGRDGTGLLKAFRQAGSAK